MRLWERSLKELSELVRKKEVKPSEIVSSFIDRKNQVDSKIKAFVSYTDELSLEEAKRKMKR